MKSLERSHKSHDLDQRDPEHLSRETNEFNWDDLKNVPFLGDAQSTDLHDIINNLPTDDESKKEKVIADAEKRVRETFNQMDEVALFGKRHNTIHEKIEPDNADDVNLSEISNTF